MRTRIELLKFFIFTVLLVFAFLHAEAHAGANERGWICRERFRTFSSSEYGDHESGSWRKKASWYWYWGQKALVVCAVLPTAYGMVTQCTPNVENIASALSRIETHSETLERELGDRGAMSVAFHRSLEQILPEYRAQLHHELAELESYGASARQLSDEVRKKRILYIKNELQLLDERYGATWDKRNSHKSDLGERHDPDEG